MARGRRRVRRVVRRIDPWSVLKVAVLFWISFVAVLVIGVAILWSLAQSSGAVGKIESFANELGFTGFKFKGPELFRVTLFGGIVFAVAGSVFSVVMAFLYNIISDLVGGIEVQVIEEETVLAEIDPSHRSGMGGRRANQRDGRSGRRGRGAPTPPQTPPRPPRSDRRGGPPRPPAPQPLPGVRPGAPSAPNGPPTQPPVRQPQPQPVGRRTVV